MAISLKKGQGVSLRKSENDQSMVTIGLGWDVRKKETGALLSIFSKKEEDYDLDVIAFLCGADERVKDLGRDKSGRATLVGGDVVFFNNMRHKSGQIWLTGDNRTGDGDGDDEQIVVKLNDLPELYTKIVFVVQIYNGIKRGQSFGNIQNAFIRAKDARGSEMARFDLSIGTQYESCQSILFAELSRETGGWRFNTIGNPSESDSFVDWLKHYV
ncbi:MAG: TerD family protein [Magnetococcales bacterium]|nr:TerD family protein [Magnetococcales bacterium]